MKDNEPDFLSPDRRRALDGIEIFLSGFPPEQRAEARLQFFADALQVMNRDQIQSLRKALLDNPATRDELDVIEIIDGHLALKDLAGEP